MNSNGYCPHGGHGPLVIKLIVVFILLFYTFSWTFQYNKYVSHETHKVGTEDNISLQIQFE